MSLSRRLFLGAALAGSVVSRSHAAEAEAAPMLISRFCDDLLAAMKMGKQAAFNDRYSRLAPAVARTFDLGLMIRIAVGPSWTQIDAAHQQQLTDAFAQYTTSEYAGRFNDFGGERFQVNPTPTNNANGLMVKSQLIKSNGEPVELDYLMRQSAGGDVRAIDVYLDGTISELASRRSEFGAVLRQSGVDGLLLLLQQRAAGLRTG